MPVGKTKDAGWQIGVSVTVPIRAADVWDWLVSPEGIAVWLGTGVSFEGEKGEAFETEEGTRGALRSFRPLDRVRLTWQPLDWDHDTTVQIALDDKGDRTRIVFHQERLADAEERVRQRDHWKAVSEQAKQSLAQGLTGVEK
jgi:uncharacterized protein YndB with AHSA1/START domain